MKEYESNKKRDEEFDSLSKRLADAFSDVPENEGARLLDEARTRSRLSPEEAIRLAVVETRKARHG